ncbi:MAG: NTP transferase domain-containing protein, partial [Pseudomonadota bacterium]
MALSILILAAGQGTRMRSDLPKVLHGLAGQPLLGHVIDCATRVAADDICVVYGHGAELVREAFADRDLRWALQAEQDQHVMLIRRLRHRLHDGVSGAFLFGLQGPAQIP